jgi:hypothetical protein
MDPKSGKPLRLFNPFSIWLKSGEAMLAAAQAAVARPKVPKVAVIPDEDAPPRKAAPAKKAARAKSGAKARKARKNASSRAKRRGR